MRPSLLMIPGTLCDESLFQYQIEELRDIATCKVVSNDSSDNLREIAANIIALQNDNFSLMGLSYGGIIAFEIWRQVPDRIDKMILMDTTHRLPTQKTMENMQRFVGMSMLGKFKNITSDILKETMLHEEHSKNIEIREQVLQMAMNVGEHRFVNQVKSQLGRPDSTADLPNIQCPTLVMVGREDVVCPLSLHQEIADKIPNAQLEIIEHSGHLCTIEQPEKVNEIIKKWWQDIDEEK